jgi:hypothetical protein
MAMAAPDDKPVTYRRCGSIVSFASTSRAIW